ncbi:hypothetical protein SASPL_126439 [Salvia splendens]|uniref:Uncharacterized protein n=1 Tax=Salvia splendens TaxID=180675 RepID=A0A8X8XH88_SALSN|nr:hypothetical protein SASPL_126439 [Salvia splendens]
MMGYTDGGGDFNTIQDPFNGRKLRPLIPRPASCLSRIHGADIFALNHHLGNNGGAREERSDDAASGGELALESDAGAAAYAGGAVPAGDADAVGGANPAHHDGAPALREDRGEECVLLVPEPQGEGEAEAAPPAGVISRRAGAKQSGKRREERSGR